MATRLRDVIVESFGAAPVDLADATELRSLSGWDSMSHMLFIAQLESTFGIQFDGDEIADMRTVGQVRQILRENHKVEV